MSKLLTPSDLSKPQIQAYKDMLTKKVMCISSDCGFGKTISCLNAFTVLLKKVPTSKMLIVCTPEGVKSTWGTEHKKWSHTKHLKIIPLVGTPKQREKLLNQEADGYAISYNSLEWLMKTNKHINFNFVFADEADCLKGPSSKWRKYLIKVAPKAKYKILSTATPKTREEDDYWGLCHYLDGGKSLQAPTNQMFKAIYCSPYTVNRRQLWRIRKDMIPILEERIKHLFIKYEMSDSAAIPIITKTMKVDLKPSSAKKYKALQDSQCLNSVVYGDDGYKDEKMSLDAMTLSGKLAQLSNGFVYVDEAMRITPELLAKASSAKDIKALIKDNKKTVAVDIFDDRTKAMSKLIKYIHKKHGSVPIAIPYYHKHELVQLQRILPTGVADTEPDFQERWNKKEIPYLFLQYSRSSKSLNLQKGGNIMVFYCPTFKWVDDYQIIRRLARQGQPESKVYAYRLYLNGTIDDIKTKKLGERFRGHTRFQNQILKKIKK